MAARSYGGPELIGDALMHFVTCAIAWIRWSTVFRVWNRSNLFTGWVTLHK